MTRILCESAKACAELSQAQREIVVAFAVVETALVIAWIVAIALAWKRWGSIHD